MWGGGPQRRTQVAQDPSYLAPLTELEAVNIMLYNIGEASVETLEGDLPLDVLKALRRIRAIAQAVQTRGWFWNRETMDLYPLVDGTIPVPTGTVAVRPARPDYQFKITVRNGILYRLEPNNNGPTFDGPVSVVLTKCLVYEELPAVARLYIALRAAREHQVQELGNAQMSQEDLSNERDAWTIMRAEDNRASRRGLGRRTDMGRITGDYGI